MTRTADDPGPEAPIQTVAVQGRTFDVRAAGERRAYWRRVSAGDWEPHTFRAFRRFIAPQAVMVDIGAWIGPTALYAAGLASTVHAVEPDPAARAELTANVAANPVLAERIVVHDWCIAPRAGPITLYAGGMYYSPESRLGDSMSGIRPAWKGQPGVSMPGLPLVDFMVMTGAGRCGFIKMDIEGGEYSLIPGRWREMVAFDMPTLLVSFHAPGASERQALIGSCLEELASSYAFLYAADDQSLIDVEAALAGVRDWADEAPGSDWRRLEDRLGAGVVCTDGVW